MDAFLMEGSGYPIKAFASHPGTEQTFLLPNARSILTLWLPRIKPSAWPNTKQPGRPKQIGTQSTLGGTQLCPLPWLNPKYSADPLQASLSPYVVPYPQAILKFHRTSSLDYRAYHRWHTEYAMWK